MSDTEYVDEDGNVVDPRDLDDYEVVDAAMYVDEDGNAVDPAELDAGGYQIVDKTDTPVPGSPAAQVERASKVPKALLAVAAVAVLAVGGGAVYALHSIGDQHTAADIKAGAERKKDEVEAGVQDRAADERAELMPVTACGGYTGSGLAAAQWTGDERPSMQLAITSVTDLPSGFRSHAGDLLTDGAQPAAPVTTWADPSQGAGTEGGSGPRLVLLQLSTSQIGVYTGSGGSVEDGGSWWKATSSVSPVRITGEGPGTGTDMAMRGACRTSFEAGDYLVTGDGSTGDRTRLSAVIASGESKSATAWAIVGTRLAQLTLERDSNAANSNSTTTPEN
ncbi:MULTISPECIES: hypothetical protein [Gordonia]|uniref:hypothetical protein n=1 Tax=Gordonia TaxID=2053 RepID=UPI0025797BE4|nr:MULTISPECIES: hypothetical protein [Gordonia]